MKTREIPVNELSGPALDWAVAVAEDKRPHLTVDNQIRVVSQYGEDFSASFEAHKRWGIAGPIIEREKIDLSHGIEKSFASMKKNFPSGYDWIEYGDSSILVAAMRCRVASKLGDTVSVPAVLVNEGE